MEWSDEMVLEFLQSFKSEPSIWDPKNVYHKKKNLVAEAWRRLKSRLSFDDSMSVEDLKKKKDSLMAYYRIHLNKMKNADPDAVYTTSWFAFSTMHSFLAPVYECTTAVNTEKTNEQEDMPGHLDIQNAVESNNLTTPTQRKKYIPEKQIKEKRGQDISELLFAKKQMDNAFSMIVERTSTKPEQMDECDLFAQLLAQKLRKLNEEPRLVLMNKIDNLVFQSAMSSKAEDQAASARGVASCRVTPSPTNDCKYVEVYAEIEDSSPSPPRCSSENRSSLQDDSPHNHIDKKRKIKEEN